MKCIQDEVPHTTILRQIALTREKSMKCRKRCSHIEKESLGMLHGQGKLSLLLLCQRGKYYHRSQSTDSNLQEEHKCEGTK